MRNYLTPAKKYMDRVLPNHEGIRAFMVKNRVYVLVVAAAFMTVTTLGFVTVRGMNGSTQQAVKTPSKEIRAEGNNVMMTTTNNTKNEETVHAGGPSTNAKTSVTVNGQPVVVPQDGTYSRTVTNDNGTTRIDVSSNTTTSGNATSSSVSSTHLNMSTNSYSHDVHIKSP